MDISIVIPTRLRDEALARCLENLRPQVADGSAEVIVTDDGTTDSTRRMIESRFAFARWTQGPRRGPAANRNHGASLARGDFVLFLTTTSSLRPTSLPAIAPPSCRDQRLRRPNDLPGSVCDHRWRILPSMRWRSPVVLQHDAAKEPPGILCGSDEAFPYPHMEDVAFRDSLTALHETILFVRDAVVDHPPRRQQSAKIPASLDHESFFVYHYKHLGRAPSLPEFLSIFMRHRPQHFFASTRAATLPWRSARWGVELIHVLRSWRAWDRKWRGVLRSKRSGVFPA